MLSDAGVELLVFAGGDGTAVNLVEANLPDDLPLIGVPTGVKMHSGVFAPSPLAAARASADYLSGTERIVEPAEIMDLDESLLRRGIVAPRLAGYVPSLARSYRQGPKVRVTSDTSAIRGIAKWIQATLDEGYELVVGPGRTLHQALAVLGFDSSLLGVDLLRNSGVVLSDATERLLLDVVSPGALVVLSPIGGQGFVLGRGNQQVGADLLRRLGFNAIRVVATPAKLASLYLEPLRIDVEGISAAEVPRHLTVITGSGRTAMYRLEAV